VRLAVISDTHLPRGNRRLPDACLAHLRESDLILHAGDLSTLAVLDLLGSLGPAVHAVHGNVDDLEVTRRLPPARMVQVGGA
jgi:putative phosphoesterase